VNSSAHFTQAAIGVAACLLASCAPPAAGVVASIPPPYARPGPCEGPAEAASVSHLAALPAASGGPYELVEASGDDRLSIEGAFQAAWLPDSRRIVTASWSYLVVWDAMTGEELVRFGPAPLSPYTLTLSNDGRFVTVTPRTGESDDRLLVDLDARKALEPREESLADLGLGAAQGARTYAWTKEIGPSPDGTLTAREGAAGGLEILTAAGAVVHAQVRPAATADARDNIVGGVYDVRLIDGHGCRVLVPSSHAAWARFLSPDLVQVAFWPVSAFGARTRVIRADLPLRIGTWSTRDYALRSLFEFRTQDDVLPIDRGDVLYRAQWFVHDRLLPGPFRRADDDGVEDRLFVLDLAGDGPAPRDPPANRFNLRLLRNMERLPVQRLLGEPWLVEALGQHPGKRSSRSEDGRWLAVAGLHDPTCPDADLLAARARGPCPSRVELWNVPERRVRIVEIPDLPVVRGLKLSDDGRLLAIAAGERVVLWDAQRWRLVQELDFAPRHDRPTEIRFDRGTDDLTIDTTLRARFRFVRTDSGR
jgi:hypothetical protein